MRRARNSQPPVQPPTQQQRPLSTREAIETLLQSLWQDLNRLETFAHIATEGFEVVLPRDVATTEEQRTAERLYVLIRAIAETSADALERVGQGLALLNERNTRSAATGKRPTSPTT